LNRFLAEPHRIDVIGAHLLDRRLKENAPTFCVSLHSGNWELAMLPFAILQLKPTALYKRITNPYLDRYIRSHRERLYSGGMVPKGGGVMESVAIRDTLRRLISSIRNGHSIGFLADPRDRRGILVPFFGHAVRVTKVPAMLARHFGGRLL